MFVDVKSRLFDELLLEDGEEPLDFNDHSESNKCKFAEIISERF
jgi:hypothetical protein